MTVNFFFVVSNNVIVVGLKKSNRAVLFPRKILTTKPDNILISKERNRRYTSIAIEHKTNT